MKIGFDCLERLFLGRTYSLLLGASLTVAMVLALQGWQGYTVFENTSSLLISFFMSLTLFLMFTVAFGHMLMRNASTIRGLWLSLFIGVEFYNMLTWYMWRVAASGWEWFLTRPIFIFQEPIYAPFIIIELTITGGITGLVALFVMGNRSLAKRFYEMNLTNTTVIYDEAKAK